MPNISLRGLDPETMAALKARASRESISVNSLVLQLIDHGLGRNIRKLPRERHDDLDALAGSWGEQDAAEFADGSAPFREVDVALWK